MAASITLDSVPAEARVRLAARHLYEAECALHVAHQTHVDAWIAAAAEKLHESVVEHLAAIAAAGRN
jgi:hypothetical protein